MTLGYDRKASIPIEFYCAEGRKHAAMPLRLPSPNNDAIRAFDVGPCGCKGDRAACELRQVICHACPIGICLNMRAYYLLRTEPSMSIQDGAGRGGKFSVPMVMLCDLIRQAKIYAIEAVVAEGGEFQGAGIPFILREKRIPRGDEAREKEKAISAIERKLARLDFDSPTFLADQAALLTERNEAKALPVDTPSAVWEPDSPYSFESDIWPSLETQPKRQYLLNTGTTIIVGQEETTSKRVADFKAAMDQGDADKAIRAIRRYLS